MTSKQYVHFFLFLQKDTLMPFQLLFHHGEEIPEDPWVRDKHPDLI